MAMDGLVCSWIRCRIGKISMNVRISWQAMECIQAMTRSHDGERESYNHELTLVQETFCLRELSASSDLRSRLQTPKRPFAMSCRGTRTQWRGASFKITLHWLPSSDFSELPILLAYCKFTCYIVCKILSMLYDMLHL